jgi:uncharacterized protein YcgI (DUF1989 family)
VQALGTQHPRPFDAAFYRAARAELATARPRDVHAFAEPGAFTIDVAAGAVVSIRLAAGPQIVNLFAYNTHDPDERLWAHETLLVEGMFLGRYSRLWGTMARFRPLLAILEDTVTTRPAPGAGAAKHHVIHGGSGTPADWHWASGPADRLTTWEQLTAGLSQRGLPPELLKDNACLFEKAHLDPHSQRLRMLASDAVTGDAVTLFAEIDVTLVLALSPYVDGSRAPSQLESLLPRRIEILEYGPLVEPLGWPYPGMGYPDLSLYLGPDGSRSADPQPTAGRESPA